MTPRLSDPAALRGLATGCLTAALALAAHGAAGATLGSGAAAVLLVLLAGGVGGLARGLQRAAEPAVLVAVLTGGQVAGHLMLAAAGHAHSALPGAPMVVAHLSAVVTGALLITGAERLYRALSTVLRADHSGRPAAPMAPRLTAPIRADHPLQSRLLVAVSISHRGPPAGVC